MSNIASQSSIGVANQLRFITLCQNGSIQSAPQTGQALSTMPLNTVREDATDFSYNKYAADDGKISGKEKLVNFGKGVISPVTTMFSSPKNFAIGAAGILGGGLLIAATGGAAAPVMVAIGAAGGAFGLLKSGYDAINAKTDDEARKAWQGLGLSSTVAISSIAGSKAALKGAGVDTKNMNVFSATIECFKKTPAQVGKSVSAFTSGKALINIKNALHINKKDTKTPEPKTDTPKPETQPEVQPETPKSVRKTDVPEPVIEEIKPAGTNVETPEGGAPKPEIEPKKPQAPKRTAKPRQRRRSRIKHEVAPKQAEQVQKEVKSITAILDDFAANNNIDPQLKIIIEDVRNISAHPMENPETDIKSLIGAIRHLESCRDNPQGISLNGDAIDFPFEETISYIDKLLSTEYKVDRLTATVGEAFNGKTMSSAFETEHTSNPAQNDTVFKMLFSGFRKQGKTTMPQFWKIRVIKYSTD